MEPYQQLERDWAAFNGLDPAGMVACSNGTAALHLSLEAMRLPPGSEVITGDFSMIAVPRAIALAGLMPVFVDCDDRLLIPQELINGVPHNDVSAVIAVHVYGRRQDMDRLWRYAAPKNWRVVEDLAEAHGVQPHAETDAACWSFYHNKIISGAEGGAVWFRDPAHAALARQLRSLGFTDAHDYTHVPRGHNYRMSNAHAELVLKSLRVYHDRFINPKVVSVERVKPGMESVGMVGDVVRGNASLRRQIEFWYDEFCPPEWRMPARDAVWVHDLRIPDLTRERQRAVVAALNAAGHAARMSFYPMSAQEEFKGCRLVRGIGDGGGWWSLAHKAAAEVFYLPVQPGQTTRESCRHCFDVIKATLPPP